MREKRRVDHSHSPSADHAERYPSEMPQTIIVVPCYNEAERLDADAFVRHVESRPEQTFLLVDDGSRDKTWEVLEALCARNPQQLTCMRLEANRGKAEAVRQGVLRAMRSEPTNVGYWDADLATPLEAIADFCSVLAEQSGVNIVMGSRVKLLGRRIDRKPARHYIGRVFATFASLVLHLPVYDTQCGAKLFRVGDVTRGLFDEPLCTSWIFDVELLGRYVQAVGRSGAEASIVEFPLHRWIDVPGSKVRMSDGLRAGSDLWKIWRRYTRHAPA